MSDIDAVSTSPTSAVPEMAGSPVGAAFSGAAVPLVAASPVKEAASLPATSSMRAALASDGTA